MTLTGCVAAVVQEGLAEWVVEVLLVVIGVALAGMGLASFGVGGRATVAVTFNAVAVIWIGLILVCLIAPDTLVVGPDAVRGPRTAGGVRLLGIVLLVLPLIPVGIYGWDRWRRGRPRD